jgi:hypothetical protein
MADPQVIQCSSQCTVTVVHEIHLPQFEMTVEQGSLIGGAIVLVWAVGYGFRVVGRQISSRASTEESE